MSRPSPNPVPAPTAIFLLHIGSMDTRLIGLSVERHWQRSIRIAHSLDEADVALIDHDRPGVDKALALLASHPHVHVVGYAFRPEGLQARHPDHLTLGKPLDIAILPEALGQAATRSRARLSVSPSNSAIPEASTPRPRPGDDEPELCGTQADLPLVPGAALPDRLFFAPELYLVGHLARALDEALRTGRPHVLSGLPRLIGVHPLPQPICVTGFRDTQLRPFSMAQLPDATARIVNALTISGSTSGDTLHAAEDLLWNTAAWASRGRLPTGIDPYRPRRLRAWPNFTRAWAAPHALRIAALWTREWISPVQLASRLDIPQRYVFSVCASAHFAGLFAPEPQVETPPAIAPEAHRPAAPLRSSILSRILRKLLNAV